MKGTPFIPETITVHLGAPSSDAANVTVLFPEYIKNVASSEIYPTWPESSLRANIYAITSYVLNRVYTEYYRGKGYDFDITSSTQYDMSFVEGRDIFQPISRIVDEIFNSYLKKGSNIEPFFAAFCDGKVVQCEGLSQCGTVTLANQGLVPYEILTYYYGDDINIISNVPVQTNTPSYAGTPLMLGMSGNAVGVIQIQLNRISRNYPGIPKIAPVDGVFGIETENAVRKFQEIFNLSPTGVVNEATWYKKEIQYYLRHIAHHNGNQSLIIPDGIYGSETRDAVENFQRENGLPVTGEVDNTTWDAIVDEYNRIRSYVEIPYCIHPFGSPRNVIHYGEGGYIVYLIQIMLNTVSAVTDNLPELEIDGKYGDKTFNAVKKYQLLSGLPVTGETDVNTWNMLSRTYNSVASGI